MESGDGVEVELIKGSLEIFPEANGFSSQVNKENGIVEYGADAVLASSSSEDTSKVEVPDFSEDRKEDSESIKEKKTSNSTKKGGSDAISQIKKTKQGSGLLNGSLGEAHEKRKALSQSLSFPSKGSRKTLTSTRQARVASSNTNGHLTAKITASGVQKTSAMNKDLGEAIISEKFPINCPSAEDGKAYDVKTKFSDSSFSTKKDDDAHSTASSTTPRARRALAVVLILGWIKRAEKRKEVL
ncbi:uncharacterized protein LOC121980144 [Zingiber officinale]|uniref:uncharacterized protein LOC121980144 n=1 Tax=Zingiber officinale TaxID=94328 RepID=UPI001C4C7689|nr:uncharacterized protein LOC121980144 [Zingiber officinale]